MSYEYKEGQGSLFINEKKSEKQPDRKGHLMLNGVLYDMAGWIRKTKSGETFLSLRVDVKPAPKARTSWTGKKQEQEEDPCPF